MVLKAFWLNAHTPVIITVMYFKLSQYTAFKAEVFTADLFSTTSLNSSKTSLQGYLCHAQYFRRCAKYYETMNSVQKALIKQENGLKKQMKVHCVLV